MKILEVEKSKSYFIVMGRKVEPEKLSRDELFTILNLVYENHDTIIFPNDDDFKNIVNPVEKEIVEQIIAKIKEFRTNILDIDKEIKNQFPDLNTNIND